MMVASFFLVAAGCGDKTVLSAASIGDLEVSEQVSFKRTAVGETDTQRVVFKNDATPETGGSVRVSDWRFAQPDGEVPVYEPAEPDDFPDRKETVNLAPGESVSFELMYSPKPGPNRRVNCSSRCRVTPRGMSRRLASTFWPRTCNLSWAPRRRRNCPLPRPWGKWIENTSIFRISARMSCG